MRINGTKSSLYFFFVYPRGEYWVQSCLTPSLMISILGQCILSTFADDKKLGRVADMPEGPAAVQSNLSWMETWDDKNLMKSKKDHRGD